MSYLSLVVFAAFATLAHADRCYLSISSPDEINGLYAPYHTDAWRNVDAYGKFGSFELKKDDAGKYFFFKDGTKILTEADVVFTADKKCIEKKSNLLSAWPKTYVFPVSYPISPPFLGKIGGYDKLKKNESTFETYMGCFDWVMQQKDASLGPPTALTWFYKEEVCAAVWGGNPKDKKLALPDDAISRNYWKASDSMKNHVRSQELTRQPAPGSTKERIFFGEAATIQECIPLAVEKGGDPVPFISFLSGSCYRSTDKTVEQVTDSHIKWTYIAVNLPGKPILDMKAFHCTAAESAESA